MKPFYWRLIPVMLFGILAFFLWRGLSLNPSALPSMQIGKSLPAFQLPNLLVPSRLLTPNTMSGHVVLLTVWASWCPACAEEQAFLLRLAREGVLIYGLNYKDHKRDAIPWLRTWGNPFQAIGEDRDGRVAIDLGVYGSPETFLIDKHGMIQYRYAGLLNETVWQQDFLPRITRLERTI